MVDAKILQFASILQQEKKETQVPILTRLNEDLYETTLGIMHLFPEVV